MKTWTALWIMLAAFCSCAKKPALVHPIPDSRITYTLQEEPSGGFSGIHQYTDGSTDHVSLREVSGYILVSPGWWSQIYDLCEVEAAKLN